MSEEPAAAAPPSGRGAWIVYTGLRLLVFVGTVGFFAIFGLNGFPLLLASVLLSSIVSLLVLRPQRAAVVAAQVARMERRAVERESLRARLDEP